MNEFSHVRLFVNYSRLYCSNVKKEKTQRSHGLPIKFKTFHLYDPVNPLSHVNHVVNDLYRPTYLRVVLYCSGHYKQNNAMLPCAVLWLPWTINEDLKAKMGRRNNS